MMNFFGPRPIDISPYFKFNDTNFQVDPNTHQGVMLLENGKRYRITVYNLRPDALQSMTKAEWQTTTEKVVTILTQAKLFDTNDKFQNFRGATINKQHITPTGEAAIAHDNVSNRNFQELETMFKPKLRPTLNRTNPPPPAPTQTFEQAKVTANALLPTTIHQKNSEYLNNLANIHPNTPISDWINQVTDDFLNTHCDVVYKDFTLFAFAHESLRAQLKAAPDFSQATIRTKTIEDLKKQFKERYRQHLKRLIEQGIEQEAPNHVNMDGSKTIPPNNLILRNNLKNAASQDKQNIRHLLFVPVVQENFGEEAIKQLIEEEIQAYNDGVNPSVARRIANVVTPVLSVVGGGAKVLGKAVNLGWKGTKWLFGWRQ